VPLDAVEVAVKRERRRISRDLHDHAGQYLVGLSLRLAALEQSLADPKRSVAFAEMRGLLDRFCQELRSISQGGHQGIPFGSDLTVALRNLALQWQGETGTAVRFHHDVAGNKCTPDGATLEALYRIAQEALTNIAKHAASASQVSIKLTSSKKFISLAIEDNGPGLDFDNRGKQPLRLGGLANMQERLAERGGQLIICCPPRGGTSITATVPTERHASG